MLVAAIDFGTTYSSWAYSLLHDYKNDPRQISAKQWQGHDSTKGPTTVLIKPDGKTLEAFGFEAETRYTELIDEDEHESYYFFKRFKMKLWNQASTSPEWLKDDLLRVSNDRISSTIRENEIHWVLTVPAIWDNAAKQFMREAAKQSLCSLIEKRQGRALCDLIKNMSYADLNILSLPVNRGVEAILMVGGFSESPMLQHAVSTEFGAVKRIVPQEASLAVLKGAVIFGHYPSAIKERISKLTYGVETSKLFDEIKHDATKKKYYEGKARCRNVFEKHVEIGQKLTVGKAQSNMIYYPLYAHQTCIRLSIFTTYDKNPMYTTDPGCIQFGDLEIPICGSGTNRWVKVRFIFGGTEIDVEATEKATGKVHHLKIDFLT
ncbi:heat shock 70 kDa protein 12A-like [Mya arenaria]|uniref:heat shock 70 kDa protein 12A-like n=1 Tax=Mya arenaria TaxID=6604 RepID=UPI0022E5E1AC|nr:heat shock 70 kDa protein 12A-like [Mya arenaria]